MGLEFGDRVDGVADDDFKHKGVKVFKSWR